jgi:hypothetical protein
MHLRLHLTSHIWTLYGEGMTSTQHAARAAETAANHAELNGTYVIILAVAIGLAYLFARDAWAQIKTGLAPIDAARTVKATWSVVGHSEPEFVDAVALGWVD